MMSIDDLRRELNGLAGYPPDAREIIVLWLVQQYFEDQGLLLPALQRLQWNLSHVASKKALGDRSIHPMDLLFRSEIAVFLDLMADAGGEPKENRLFVRKLLGMSGKKFSNMLRLSKNRAAGAFVLNADKALHDARQVIECEVAKLENQMPRLEALKHLLELKTKRIA